MNKTIKIYIILTLSIVWVIFWAALFFTSTKEQTINYWWQAGMAAIAILFGVFGMLTAKKWSWLKSGVGQGVFFISLGVVMWGLGQAGWTYYLLKYPGQEVVQSKIIDVLYFASIPLWTYGILKLSKATGAKFGLKSVKGKILVAALSLIMVAFSYYFLVVVARGGLSYFDGQSVWISFFDLGYAIGDAINLTIAIAIFGLSWRYLGGRFKGPIMIILASFGLIYLADFLFSYYDGNDMYYNGNAVDLLYLLTIATLGLALCMLDPSKKVISTPVENTSNPDKTIDNL
ncbi:MAG: hypothetical protein WCP03_01145 [Candidatus Saccharibacteria bacterium]